MLYQSLNIAHHVASIIWLGGGALLSLIALRARFSGDTLVLGNFAKKTLPIGQRLLLPVIGLVLLSGLSLVFMNEAWSFSQLWVRLAVAAFVVVFLIGAAYLGRIGTELGRLANRPGSRQAMENVVGSWLLGYALVLAILAFAVWDMMVKPGF